MIKKEAFEKFGEKCPTCGSEWKITMFNVKVWLDCIKCNKRAEDILKDNKLKSEEIEFEKVTINDYPAFYPY